MCRYLFVRCDNEPAPWSSEGEGEGGLCYEHPAVGARIRSFGVPVMFGLACGARSPSGGSCLSLSIAMQRRATGRAWKHSFHVTHLLPSNAI